MGMDSHLANNIETALRVGLVITLALVLWSLLRLFLLFIKKRLLSHLEMSLTGSEYIISILKQTISIIALIFTLQLLPDAFTQKSAILSWSLKATIIAIIFFATGILNCFLKIGYDIISKKDRYKQRPIKGFMQILQIAIYFLATILTVAAIIEKSPLGLLTGLGAFAAVLSFIFKDTILGFIAGIQLSYNDMVRPGDWIVVNNTLANGTVTEISLITVKVQNFDNTIVNVPTYSLITTPFQNWRGMDESGGRRINLNINIDMRSVTFCSAQELVHYNQYVQIPKWTELTDTACGSAGGAGSASGAAGGAAGAANSAGAVGSAGASGVGSADSAGAGAAEAGGAGGADSSAESTQITNLELYRMYLLKLILKNPQINKELMIMVRYLQPGPQGIPLQIYCFSKNKGWVTYEAIQAAILEQAVASAPLFNITLFQTVIG